MLPVNEVICGDCITEMEKFPPDSVDLVVTSPPYWGLRDYGSETVRIWGGDPECKHEWDNSVLPAGSRSSDARTSITKTVEAISHRDEWQSSNFCSKCGAWRGSLGLEPHPQQFIDHLVEICQEIRRVLKPSGTFWLNLGDTYFSGAGKSRNPGGDSKRGMDRVQPASSPNRTAVQDGAWLQPKQKLMMPARVAIALQHDGWILRSDIIWHKPNHMPSSVKDRLTAAYEHVFLFVKQRHYYFDLDAIRKPQKSLLIRHEGKSGYREDHPSKWAMKERSLHAHGKNPGDVWRIPTTPFPGAHFATFPPKLIAPIIKAGSPRWICSKCGEPRTRITEPTPEYAEKLGKSVHDHKDDLKRGMRYDKVTNAEYVTTGWTDCGCGAGWNPSVVLDPFGGSGTVGQVARRLGRRFILIEIIPEYCKMAEQRVRGRYKPIPTGVVPLDQIMEAEK